MKAAVKKKHPKSKFHKKAGVRKRRPQGLEIEHGWMVAGFDVSMSSMAGAAMAYDQTCDKFRGPAFIMRRWSKEDHYFERLKMAAKSHELILDLCAELKVVMACNEIYIAQEEPFPPHSKFMMKGQSGFLKQQAEVSGAFLGGLLRYGYDQIWQIGNTTWRKVVADQISEATGEDVTLHPSKWNNPKLAEQYNCKPKDAGKFRAKQWALDVVGPWAGQMNNVEIPDWPDIIEHSKLGKIPRPEDSKAKAIQPDDRYDALGVMEALRLDIQDELQRAA